jgi:hypothetical protein
MKSQKELSDSQLNQIALFILLLPVFPLQLWHGISTSNQIMNKANQKQPCQGNPNQAST